jgi:type I restriction-modification system DNA methylase subunit/restriction endonuclease S subunit
MGRSTVHYADNETNNILKRLHNKLRPAGTPVERVEYIIELLLLRIFETKIKHDKAFAPLRKLFEGEDYRLLFSHLLSLTGEQILSALNKNIFPFYSTILTKTREVISGNLPTKMQDQLVLMEEVFANSNFTNNVKGGVIAEVIGLINEIDEKWILKTDLLGDAIESALSETGGTKDLGLYRTPNHIRQMMVQMVDPCFDDSIFDPACGTAGFLFDAYEYVIEKAKRLRQIPSENVANQFYRAGIGGIEYQGRIRKMAAVNMYIRGLNPHNIEQGDSLKLYDPSKDHESKSVVIANPPFGAERDQPAYPNVWEDYSKESETTILFVKLMFELLKQNGRCAVVVSEGFLTWGQNSACALRKILLNDANLRAVISLPQGVFVSKSGQGAKTSILYFEKGTPTEFVWFYKIENDGFSMGTNRKEITGSQIPELLKIFKDVKQGKKPKNTKHSFCVSKEQIETLDPRIIERIRKEVSKKIKDKNTKKREKLIKDLNEKLKNKKISKAIQDEKLWQFDNVTEGQVDNEVVKAIEKAHSYHFNLQNYRSNLSKEQIKDWRETLKGVEIKNGSKIEKRYKDLQKAESQIALQILASFDPKNSLQMDIAREYLSKLDKKILEQDEKVTRLFGILKETKQFPFERLGDLINRYLKTISIEDTIEYKRLSIKMNQKGVSIRDLMTGVDIGTKKQFIVKSGQFLISKIDALNGAYGIIPQNCDASIITGNFWAYNIDQLRINPLFLVYILSNKKFTDFCSGTSIGSTQRRYLNEESLKDFQIPLPPLEVQNEIVEKINKQKKIIEGAETISDSYEPDGDQFFEIYEEKKLGNYIEEISEKNKNGDTITVFLVSKNKGMMPSEEYFSDRTIKKISSDDLSGYKIIKKNQFAYSGIHANEGAIGYLKNYEIGLLSPIYRVFSVDTKSIIPEYLNLILKSRKALYYYNQNTIGAIDRRTNLDFDYFCDFRIPLPPIEIQNQIVEKLDQQMQALEGVRLLKSEAEKKIEEILNEVWG